LSGPWELWSTLAHLLSGDGYVDETGIFFKVKLLDSLTSVIFFVKPITPGIILHWHEDSNTEMES
jgi:hypothetical protein